MYVKTYKARCILDGTEVTGFLYKTKNRYIRDKNGNCIEIIKGKCFIHLPKYLDDGTDQLWSYEIDPNTLEECGSVYVEDNKPVVLQENSNG